MLWQVSTDKTYFRMVSGQMKMDNKEKYTEHIRNLKDGLYELKISKVYDKRSNPQNRYYWGVIVPACQRGMEETGSYVDLNEAHETLKANCNYEEKASPDTGKVFKIIRSTATRNTAQFTRYVERCRTFIREFFNIETPDPE